MSPRLHDDSIQALADAGIFELRMPVRYGGYEADTRTSVDVSIELGRADGASAARGRLLLCVAPTALTTHDTRHTTHNSVPGRREAPTGHARRSGLRRPSSTR